MPLEELLAMTHTTHRLTIAALAASVCLNLLACNVDEPATFLPRSGTWTYEEEAEVSNSCGDLVGALNPGSTFNLDYDEGDSFQIELGEDDVVCEIDGTAFTCTDYTVGPNQVPTLQAFITYAVRLEGDFTSETIADGSTTTSVTCTGEDCTMIDTLPCSRVLTFTAEFVN
jgi:hypothetical protein